MRPVALTIAGSDPSGGAGLQADLKTFHQHGAYGCAVVTLLSVQNTVALSRVEVAASDLVGQQLDAVLEDIPPAAIKTGALGSRENVLAVAERLAGSHVPLVVDPVLASTSGTPLLGEAAHRALLEKLFPCASLVTPNLLEVEALIGMRVRAPDDARKAAEALVDCGARAVLVKGGHLQGAPVDILYAEGSCHELESARIETPHTHGLGCTLSAAITARLARGDSLLAAVLEAKAWLTRAIASAPGLGRGAGSVNHFEPVG